MRYSFHFPDSARMFCTACAFATLTLWVSDCNADDAPETVLDGLNNPCGVTIQPETGDVFVADSGAGRVIRVVDGMAQDVIIGFPIDINGKGPMYNIGPSGLAFIDQDTLVVGGGSKPDGEEMLRVYKVPAKGAAAIKAEEMLSSKTLPPIAVDEGEEIKGDGNFYGLAFSNGNVYVSCNGDDTKGWISLAVLQGNKIKSYQRFISTKEATKVDALVGGIAIEPKHAHLAVSRMGELTVPGDSLLTFYSSKDGSLLQIRETSLSDIVAMDYSPDAEPQLYVLDFSWHDTSQGGLFHLVSKMAGNEPVIDSIPIASLDKPTAMKFAADGSLYVTVIGTPTSGSVNPPGKLLRFSPRQLRK